MMGEKKIKSGLIKKRGFLSYEARENSVNPFTSFH
jgi:hypothetical protein